MQNFMLGYPYLEAYDIRKLLYKSQISLYTLLTF